MHHFLTSSLSVVIFILLPFADHCSLLFLVESVTIFKASLDFFLFGHAICNLVIQILLIGLFTLFSSILYLGSLERILLEFTHPGLSRLLLSLLESLIDVLSQ